MSELLDWPGYCDTLNRHRRVRYCKPSQVSELVNMVWLRQQFPGKAQVRKLDHNVDEATPSKYQLKDTCD